jgi:hypothetical protein
MPVWVRPGNPKAEICTIYIMSAPISPRLLKGGIVLIDPDSGAVQRVIALQYSPATGRMLKGSCNP